MIDTGESCELSYSNYIRKQMPFTTPSRSDGLVLCHWERKPVGSTETKKPEATNVESSVSVNERWIKHNVRVNGPEYTDEEYDAKLKSDDWSREETDYLINLALDYDLRWVVVSDRYDFQPSKTSEPLGDDLDVSTPTIKPRTTEDMKARYYEVAAKIMEERRPV